MDKSEDCHTFVRTWESRQRELEVALAVYCRKVDFTPEFGKQYTLKRLIKLDKGRVEGSNRVHIGMVHVKSAPRHEAAALEHDSC